MNLLNYYRNPAVIKTLFERVLVLAQQVVERLGRPVIFMEVCGTHTTAISKLGLRRTLQGLVELRSGPGCPVCVTHSREIDLMLNLAGLPCVTVLTFGDMLRVPGSHSSLEEERARGGSVKIVYSPFQAVELAQTLPEKQFIMLGVGFETTTPMVALTLANAESKGIKNLSVLTAHKLVPPILRVLLADPEIKLDGLILPGHVAAITGCRAFDFISSKFGLPAVVTGFEPVDILEGVRCLLEQLKQGKSVILNGYRRLVGDKENNRARSAVEQYFQKSDSLWRGFGRIPDSGLFFISAKSDFDAIIRFKPTFSEGEYQSACCCGDLLKGKMIPPQCGLYRKVCRPNSPVGPCMVSSEGVCAAYFEYED